MPSPVVVLALLHWQSTTLAIPDQQRHPRFPYQLSLDVDIEDTFSLVSSSVVLPSYM